MVKVMDMKVFIFIMSIFIFMKCGTIIEKLEKIEFEIKNQQKQIVVKKELR
jgi:hypothetical protein